MPASRPTGPVRCTPSRSSTDATWRASTASSTAPWVTPCWPRTSPRRHSSAPSGRSIGWTSPSTLEAGSTRLPRISAGRASPPAPRPSGRGEAACRPGDPLRDPGAGPALRPGGPGRGPQAAAAGVRRRPAPAREIPPRPDPARAAGVQLPEDRPRHEDLGKRGGNARLPSAASLQGGVRRRTGRRGHGPPRCAGHAEAVPGRETGKVRQADAVRQHLGPLRQLLSQAAQAQAFPSAALSSRDPKHR